MWRPGRKKKKAEVLGGSAASVPVGLPVSLRERDGADRFGEKAAELRAWDLHDGISWQARRGQPEKHLDEQWIADRYAVLVPKTLSRFGVGEEQNRDGGVALEGEMGPLGGDEFLGPQQAMEVKEQGRSSTWKAACAEPPPYRSDERREKGSGTARQLMLLPGANCRPGAA